MARLTERATYLERVAKLKQEQLTLTEEQAERTNRLKEEGLVSKDLQADARIRRAQALVDLEQLEAELRETRIAVQKQRLAQQAQAASFQEEERQLLDKLAEAQIQREAKGAGRSARRRACFIAPRARRAVRLAVRAAGTVVREGDTLAEIACDAERLQVELTLPQEALSRIQPGQRVKLLYDAFPYQHYGVKEALVRWTSPAAASGAGGLEFRAFAELEERSIKVAGIDRPLLPGMKGKARILVGRRSVISYVFGPLRQLEEAVR
jgi:membrane fusion protein